MVQALCTSDELIYWYITVFGLVLQSVRNDGLIRTIGPRYLLFLGLAGAAFVAGLIPRYFDMVILISTAFLGAFAFAIGIVST
jgi:hypothetical protein